MKNILSILSISLATIAGNTCIAAASPRPDYVTEAQSIQDLMTAFERIPSIPGKATPDTTFINTHGLKGAALSDYLFSHNIMYAYQSPRILPNVPGFGAIPITLRSWLGLQCVFPDVPKSQWAQKLGLATSSPDAPASAGLVSKWIVDWAKKARGVVPGVRGIPGNPYQLVRDFTGFYGTDILYPTSHISVKDMASIAGNLYDMSVGYRLLSKRELQLLPILGQSSLYTEFKHDDVGMDKGFALIDKGITLTFPKDGNVVYHHANGNGIELGVGPWALNQTELEFGGWGFPNQWMKNPQAYPQPKFYGAETVIIHKPSHGVFAYSTLGGGFVTPSSWKIHGSLEGITTGAIVTYSNGRIDRIDPFGKQYSFFGYPGK